MLQPVLEVHVLWHPKDATGAAVADELAAHFHGGMFASLLAGAMEVYQRSVGWQAVLGPPRPIPWPDEPPQAGSPRAARHVAVVLLAGLGMAQACQPPGSAWQAYVQQAVAAQQRDPRHVRLLPLALGKVPAGWLANALPPNQFLAAVDPLAAGAPLDAEAQRSLRCRDLSQALAQWLHPVPDQPLRVFISHTKRLGSPDEPVADLAAAVRAELQAGRVASFYDAHDLKPGADWDAALRDGSASSALLALRTDLYASREWCQREMLTAKLHGMPVLVLDAMSNGETRGSFLMDHAPRIPVRRDADGPWGRAAIRRAIDLLADAWLHRVLWLRHQEHAQGEGMLSQWWWAPQAPEPATLARWLTLPGGDAAPASADAASHPAAAGLPRMPAYPAGTDLRILHPDPPLAGDERAVLQHLVRLAGYGQLDLTTPRLLAARGA